jgi:hypothetical protein
LTDPDVINIVILRENTILIGIAWPGSLAPAKGDRLRDLFSDPINFVGGSHPGDTEKLRKYVNTPMENVLDISLDEIEREFEHRLLICLFTPFRG